MFEDDSMFPYFLGCGVSFILTTTFVVLMIINAGGLKKINFASNFMQIVRTFAMFGMAFIVVITSWFGAIAAGAGLICKEWKKYNYFGSKKEK